jgi:hypothetical protein
LFCCAARRLLARALRYDRFGQAWILPTLIALFSSPWWWMIGQVRCFVYSSCLCLLGPGSLFGVVDCGSYPCYRLAFVFHPQASFWILGSPLPPFTSVVWHFLCWIEMRWNLFCVLVDVSMLIVCHVVSCVLRSSQVVLLLFVLLSSHGCCFVLRWVLFVGSLYVPGWGPLSRPVLPSGLHIFLAPVAVYSLSLCCSCPLPFFQHYRHTLTWWRCFGGSLKVEVRSAVSFEFALHDELCLGFI